MKLFKITLNGKSCVMEDANDLLSDISLMIHEGETQPITIQVIEMPEEEFDKMEEFNGY